MSFNAVNYALAKKMAAESARGGAWETYNAEAVYAIGNKVSYNGSSYVCIANSTGNLPTDTDYWLLIASKGDTGPQGEQGPKGEDGAPGADGITPHIGVNGNWYLGETDTGVKAEGKDGKDGADGYTPMRGTDYWTTTDQAAIVADVLAAVNESILGGAS